MKTRNVAKFKYQDYLKRAEECAASANHAFESQMYTSCVMNAIHCAIAAADALCVYKLGLRHAGESHNEAIALFASIDFQDKELAEKAAQLGKLLSIKTRSEYGEELMSKKDAEQAQLIVQRFSQFVKNRLPQ